MTRRAAAAFVLIVAGAGCRDVESSEGLFDVPVASAVLQPEDADTFDEPIGFVANGHGGRIVPLALKQGRVVTDDPLVSFLRTNMLPTGTGRTLSSVAVTTEGEAIILWAGDRGWGTLLAVPYVLDCTLPEPPRECEGALPGAPVEQQAWWEILQAAPSATLTDIVVKTGSTATETWTGTYDGSVWVIDGSRSGRQDAAVAGVPFVARDRAVEFTIVENGPAPSEGDTFVLKTRNGLTEHDVGGIPLSLLARPDGSASPTGQELLAMVVQDTSTDRPVVRWFDTVTRQVVGDVALPVESRPHRLALAEEGALLVADQALPAVWEVPWGGTAPIEHVVPWPTLDVASLNGDVRRALFVVPLDGGSLWLLDRDTDAFVDTNGSAEGTQGMDFTSTVAGIESLNRRYLMLEHDEDEVRVQGRSVAISLSTGSVVFAHEDTGCLVQDPFGPRSITNTAFGSTGDYLLSTPGAALGPPLLELDGASNRHIVAHPCGGIAKPESWAARFDGNVQAWRVTGSISGDQENLAYEEERYLSDLGEISFTIRSGASPSRDGWQLAFTIDDGLADANGDFDGDGIIDVSVGIGSDPVPFYYRVGMAGPVDDYAGTGWLPVDVRPFVLVVGSTSNEVVRVDASDAVLEVGWE